MTELVHELMDDLTAKEILSVLPPRAIELLKVIQMESLLKLIDYYGGVRLYIPLTMQNDHQLVKLIGWDEAKALSKEFGGLDHFSIPRGGQIRRLERNKQILRMSKDGASQRQLAIQFQMSDRGICKILKECKINNI